jgi:hypothetical protein
MRGPVVVAGGAAHDLRFSRKLSVLRYSLS